MNAYQTTYRICHEHCAYRPKHLVECGVVSLDDCWFVLPGRFRGWVLVVHRVSCTVRQSSAMRGIVVLFNDLPIDASDRSLTLRIRAYPWSPPSTDI